jgi:hypothetical protein
MKLLNGHVAFARYVSLVILVLSTFALGQNTKPAPAAAAPDFSGTYSFLRDGETVQINIDPSASLNPDGSRPITGYITRFGDLDSDKDKLLDHFFTKGSVKDDNISFTTKTVHGVSFDFTGKVQRGPGKTSADEGYFVIQGTLQRNSTDAKKKTSSQSREVVFKLFPDLEAEDPGASPPKS